MDLKYKIQRTRILAGSDTSLL